MSGPTLKKFFRVIDKTVGDLLPSELKFKDAEEDDYPQLDKIFFDNIDISDTDDFWPTVYSDVEDALYDICEEDGLDTDEVKWDEVSSRLEHIS